MEIGFIRNEAEMKVLNYLHLNCSEAFDKERWLLLGAGYCFWNSIGCTRSNIDCGKRRNSVLVIALSEMGPQPRILVLLLFLASYLDFYLAWMQDHSLHDFEAWLPVVWINDFTTLNLWTILKHVLEVYSGLTGDTSIMATSALNEVRRLHRTTITSSESETKDIKCL